MQISYVAIALTSCLGLRALGAYDVIKSQDRGLRALTANHYSCSRWACQLEFCSKQAPTHHDAWKEGMCLAMEQVGKDCGDVVKPLETVANSANIYCPPPYIGTRTQFDIWRSPHIDLFNKVFSTRWTEWPDKTRARLACTTLEQSDLDCYKGTFAGECYDDRCDPAPALVVEFPDDQ